MAGSETPLFAEMWARERQTVADQVAAGIASHAEGEDHRRPRGLAHPGCDFGIPGTPLTQTGIWGHRVVDFPCEVNTWHLLASPGAGSAVVDVLLAADVAAFAAGSYSSMCTGAAPTLSGQRATSGDALNTWPTVAVPAGGVLVFELVSVSGGIDVLTAELQVRRT